jgi:hypothetical protein
VRRPSGRLPPAAAKETRRAKAGTFLSESLIASFLC